MEREFTAVIRKRGKWYVGFVEEIPGVNSQARTISELRRNLREALRLILEANRQLVRQGLRGRVRREPIGVNARQ
jgi:predicted RNase H-like HicB family nuclease